MGKWYYQYAVIAGLFASAASFFGKFTSEVKDVVSGNSYY